MTVLYRIRARAIDGYGRLSAIVSPFFVNKEPILELLQFEYYKRAESFTGVSVEEWCGKKTTRIKAEEFLKRCQTGVLS